MEHTERAADAQASAQASARLTALAAELAPDAAAALRPALHPYLSVSPAAAWLLWPALAVASVGACAAGGGLAAGILSSVLCGGISLGMLALLCRARRDGEHTDSYLQHLSASPAYAAAAQALQQAQPQPQQLEGGDEDAGDRVALMAAQGAVAGRAAAALRAPRLHYIDNLRTALTILVVAHHVFGAFAGGGSLGLSVGNYRHGLTPLLVPLQILDQSYFMALFFFISAFLAPPSLDRKGVREFLADRFQRLAIPFLIALYIAGPLVGVLVEGGAIGRGVTWTPTPLSAWFLCYLLVFSVCYALVNGDVVTPAAPRPSLLLLCAAGAALGALQAVQIVYAPAYPLMPITFGSLPFDIAFFAAGIYARRGGWLEGALGSAWELAAAYAVVIATSLGGFAAAAVLYSRGGGYAFMAANACGEAADRGMSTLPPDFIGNFFGMSILLGVFAVCMSIVALDFCRARCNTAGPLSRWLAANAYAAYLLHPLVVVPLTWAAVAAYRSLGASIDFAAGSVDSTSCLTPPRLRSYDAAALAAGFVCVLFASLAIVFPLAAAVRRLPRARSVLG